MTARLPLLFRLRSSTAFIVLSVATAIFTETFLYGLLIPIFPDLLRLRVAIPEKDVQIFTSLLVGLMGAGTLTGSLLFGWIADHSQNRRTSLLGGLLLFTGATTAIWLGRHIAILCVGRFLQGFAGASIWSVGLALIIDTVGSKDVAETMGYANLAFTSGYMAGPTVGGVVYAAGGHHAVFSLAVGLLGLDMLLRLLIIEKKDAKEVLRAYHEEEDEDGGAAARPLLDDRDRSSSATAQPPASREFAYQSLITSKRLLISLVCAFMQAFLVTSFEATLPLRLRELFNFGSAEAGLTFIALLLPSILATPIGYICNKFGNRQIAALGYVVCGVATILLRLPKNNDIPSKVGLIADLAFIGTSMCAVMTPVLTEVFVSVEDLEEQKPGRFGPFGAFAQAYGLFNVCYAGGTLTGPILSGLMKSKLSWGAMCIGLSVLSFSAGLLIVPKDKVITYFRGKRTSTDA